jgi:hypothetical protein
LLRNLQSKALSTIPTKRLRIADLEADVGFMKTAILFPLTLAMLLITACAPHEQRRFYYVDPQGRPENYGHDSSYHRYRSDRESVSISTTHRSTDSR